jgi:hypothetical protein
MQKPQSRWLPLAALLLAAATIVPAASAQLSAASTAPSSHLTAASDYADLNSPSGHILFGSPLPQVEIQSAKNASLAATLALTYLLELAPNESNPAHPNVLAVAAPETLARFNGSIPPAVPWVNLIATLPVYRASTPLWSNGTSVAKAAESTQQAILDVNYSVASAPDGSPGVLVSWSVSGWPWVVPSGDELALEYQLDVVAGAGFETCTGAATTNAPSSNCAAESLSARAPVWGSGLTALRGSGPAGSVAWVSWGQTVGGSFSSAAPVNAGAYSQGPGDSALVIAALTDGAAAVAGATLFFLSPESASAVVGVLVGELPLYGGAAAIFAAVAGIGIVLSRRRDRAIARELSA